MLQPKTARLLLSLMLGLTTFAGGKCVRNVRADDESVLLTPPGFHKPGQAVVKAPVNSGRLKVTVRDARTGAAAFCRVNVVGSDGNFYYPKQNYLTPYALTGRWPKMGMGNREGKAPIRYLGRFFYSWGDFEIELPPGAARVEVWKGLEYRPEVASTTIDTGQDKSLEIKLTNETGLALDGYAPGDSHLHFRRQTDADDQAILDLMEAEDIRYGSILAYNEPAGPYAGIMETLAAPQFRGLGTDSLRERGEYHFVSGQEYRSATYGHLNLYFRNDLVLANQHVNANNGPLYGVVARETRDKGGLIGKVLRGSLRSDVEAKVFNAAPGDLLGPFASADRTAFEIFRMNAKHPARLDEDTSTEVRRLLGEDWLQARAREHVVEAG